MAFSPAMNGRWRFRVVSKDCSGTYVQAEGAALEHVGTDGEALEIAKELRVKNPEAAQIQAVSVGCPAGITETPGRLLVFATARADRRGWMLTGNWMSGTWHKTIADAVHYGGTRTMGYESETRIVTAKGTVTHVVLIPGLHNGQKV